MTLRTDVHAAIDEIAPPVPGLAGQIVASIASTGRETHSLPSGELRKGRFARPSFQWTGGFVAALLALAVVSGLLYSRGALSLPGSTAAINTGVATTTEYPFPTGPNQSAVITAGPDGNLYIGTGASVAKVTTSGGFTEYAVPTASTYPDVTEGGITMGPDGNIWFTERVSGEAEGKVAKMTTSGGLTEYAIPDASPGDITAGPDGNLWLIDGAANVVVKVTTSGRFTEYPIPTRNGTPRSITAGPDGNLWFVETTAGKVAKVTTSGRITEYMIPSGNLPYSITAGKDGNLWFTEVRQGAGASVGRLAKVTTSGRFIEYTIPIANSIPGAITEGPDGNLWFLDGNKVVKITTSGSFTAYTIPRSAGNLSPRQITAGPDGNIWFTERPNGYSLAKVVIVDPEAQAIQLVLKELVFFDPKVFPQGPGRQDCTIKGGGPYPGLRIPGSCQTSAVVDGAGGWLVTFTQYWDASRFSSGPKTGTLSYRVTYDVDAKGKVTQRYQGGDFPPQEAY